jgi:predicted SnoaL-like aldol condensation-catalyzing enzyme
MSIEENKQFVRNHFEQFVNKKDLSVADRNFAPNYQEHGSDAPSDDPPGPGGPKRYLAAAFKRFPDIHVTIEDIVAEGDKVVVRNTLRATDSQSKARIEFGGIVMCKWPTCRTLGFFVGPSCGALSDYENRLWS